MKIANLLGEVHLDALAWKGVWKMAQDLREFAMETIDEHKGPIFVEGCGCIYQFVSKAKRFKIYWLCKGCMDQTLQGLKRFQSKNFQQGNPS